MSANSDSHVYASPGWLRAVCDIVEQELAATTAGLAGCDYVLGETFLDVPAAVNDCRSAIGWHVRINGGRVTTATEPPPPEADMVNIADWETTESLSHRSFGDVASDPTLAATIATLYQDGKLQRVVRRPQPPVLAGAFNAERIHDAVVAITAPRPTL